MAIVIQTAEGVVTNRLPIELSALKFKRLSINQV